MTKLKIRILIPLVIIFTFLAYTWAVFFIRGYSPGWHHYAALILFCPLIFYYFRKIKRAVPGTGIFLLLGAANLFSLTPARISNRFGLKIGSVELWTPSFQLLSFLIFIIYFLLNFSTLVEMYLDYRESKGKI